MPLYGGVSTATVAAISSDVRDWRSSSIVFTIDHDGLPTLPFFKAVSLPRDDKLAGKMKSAPRKPLPSLDVGTATVPFNVAPDHRNLACESLFRQGDASIGIYLLKSGRIRLQRITPDGASVSIHLARPGELFAEASLFSHSYHCDAIAEVDSEVWRYPKDQLSQRLRTGPEALWAFARELASRLQGLRLRYELKQVRSATERVLQLPHEVLVHMEVHHG